MLPGHDEFLFLPFQVASPKFRLFRLRTILQYILKQLLSGIFQAALRSPFERSHEVLNFQPQFQGAEYQRESVNTSLTPLSLLLLHPNSVQVSFCASGQYINWWQSEKA